MASPAGQRGEALSPAEPAASKHHSAPQLPDPNPRSHPLAPVAPHRRQCVRLGKARGSAYLWETSKVFNLSEPQFPDP